MVLAARRVRIERRGPGRQLTKTDRPRMIDRFIDYFGGDLRCGLLVPARAPWLRTGPVPARGRW